MDFVSRNCFRHGKTRKEIDCCKLLIWGSSSWMAILKKISKNLGKKFLMNVFLLAAFCFQFLLPKRSQIFAYDHLSLVKAYSMPNAVSPYLWMKCQLLILVFCWNKTKMWYQGLLQSAHLLVAVIFGRYLIQAALLS